MAADDSSLPRPAALPVLALLIATTFVIDLLAPPHFAGWALYLPATVAAAMPGRRRLAWTVAGSCMALVVAGGLVQATRAPLDGWDLLNRAIAIAAIAAAALVAQKLASAAAARHLAQASRARSEQRLAAVINTATDAIVTVDESQSIVMINPAAETLFGHPPGSLDGKPLVTLIPARFRAGHGEHVARFGGTGKTVRRMGGKVDVFGVRADGSEFPVDASISHFREDGRTLYTVILRDITAKKAAEEALTHSQRELRALSENLQTVREEERKRIARELHDDLGQRLAALRNDFTLLRRGLGDPATQHRNAEGIDNLLVDTIASLRRISADLRPRPLDDLGLTAAVRVLASEFSRQHGVACEVVAPAAEPVLDGTAAAAAYRMVQEALNNAAKHAAATRVAVTLDMAGGALTVSVADDGRGIAEADLKKRGSFGLIGMRERATALGGQLTVASGERGTTLTFSVPAARQGE